MNEEILQDPVAVLKEIQAMTNPADAESYRADDPQGCLDYIYDIVSICLNRQKAGDEMTDCFQYQQQVRALGEQVSNLMAQNEELRREVADLRDSNTMLTPGEWIYFDDVESPFWGEIRSAETFDVIAHQVDGDDRTEDFKLMAAAPKLLAACELAHRIIDAVNKYNPSGDSYRAIKLLNTAIAKAKGETNE